MSPGYGAVMGIPLRRGRWFDDRDDKDSPRVAVISESVATRRFPGADPIGQLLRISSPDRPPFTIVGVVGDVRQQSLDAVTYLGVVAVVVSVGTIACALPAWRAGHIDPVAVLKEQE